MLEHELYTIGLLNQESSPCINDHYHPPYNIQAFKDEVLCDEASLEFCDVFHGQPYMCKQHDMYQSMSHIVIINLGIGTT